MARTFYRTTGPRGRFVKAADAERLEATRYVQEVTGGDVQRFAFEDWRPPPEPSGGGEEAPAEMFWTSRPDGRFVFWEDFRQDVEPDLSPFAPPAGVSKFRLFARMESDSTGEKGWASSGWFDIAEWPPTTGWIGAHGAPRFDHIRFQVTDADAES